MSKTLALMLGGPYDGREVAVKDGTHALNVYARPTPGVFTADSEVELDTEVVTYWPIDRDRRYWVLTTAQRVGNVQVVHTGMTAQAVEAMMTMLVGMEGADPRLLGVLVEPAQLAPDTHVRVEVRGWVL